MGVINIKLGKLVGFVIAALVLVWTVYFLISHSGFALKEEYVPKSDTTVTTKVFMDISIDGKDAGTVVFGLFGATSPITVKNFVTLATGSEGYGYEGSVFHRVVKGFVVQGGDFVSGNGYGFKSIYGEHFDDENFNVKHYGAGWLNMANRGPNTNGCQFSVLMREAPWLDGHHTVFGKVLEGMSILRTIENIPTNDKEYPSSEVKITKCGETPVDRPFEVDTRAVEE